MLALRERLRSHLQEIIRERDVYLATEGHFYVSNTFVKRLVNGE